MEILGTNPIKVLPSLLGNQQVSPQQNYSKLYYALINSASQNYAT